MHLENWIYRVLCGNARTGKISKQKVQFALAETVPQGLRNRDSANGSKVCGRTNVGGMVIRLCLDMCG